MHFKFSQIKSFVENLKHTLWFTAIWLLNIKLFQTYFFAIALFRKVEYSLGRFKSFRSPVVRQYDEILTIIDNTFD